MLWLWIAAAIWAACWAWFVVHTWRYNRRFHRSWSWRDTHFLAFALFTAPLGIAVQLLAVAIPRLGDAIEVWLDSPRGRK